MEKKMILLFGVVFILASAFVVAFSGFSFNGKNVSEMPYSYTKAICNIGNECQDFLVICKSFEVKSLSPISEVVKFGKDWKDFREKEELC